MMSRTNAELEGVDSEELMEKLGVDNLNLAFHEMRKFAHSAAKKIGISVPEVRKICKKMMLMLRITKLEITLDSFGYREFIPFVKVLLFEKNETLWHLLDATIDIESLVPKVAIHCAFEAKLFEVGEAFDEHSTDGMSPNEMQNHSHSVEVEDYYEKNVEQVQDAVMSILHHPRCRNLYYTLSSQTEPESKPTRLIQDEVHGSIKFDKWIFESIIDTEVVQRLRGIAQLGFGDRVFPCANHSRFVHSLGVGHLAGVFFDQLLEAASCRHDRETRRLRNCLAIAGITHDLGHGPFSHSFETSFISELHDERKREWRHEKMSEALIDRIFEAQSLQNFPSEDVVLIKQMIHGNSPSCSNRTWCSDTPESLVDASCSIICNRRNGIDVDRFDYLQRDAVAGDNFYFDPNRIMKFAKIIDGEICFRDKERDNVFEMFKARHKMFNLVYTHPKVRGIEIMAMDALKMVDPMLNISSIIDDVDKFLHLTDASIINQINWLKEDDYPDLSDKIRIRSAKDLLNRIDRRLLYRFCGEIELDHSSLELYGIDKVKEEFNPANIIKYVQSSVKETILPESDIVLDWNSIDYGVGAENPMSHVSFYSKDNNTEKKKCKSPFETAWKSHTLRIYCRSNPKADALSSAFFRWADSLPPEMKHAATSGGSRNAAQSPTCPRVSSGTITFPRFPLSDFTWK